MTGKLKSYRGFDGFARSTVFRNILKERLKTLNVAFICFYGSRNYGLESPQSDYDFFIVYYPSFDNFYDNRFERLSVIESDYDYFITPFHEYISHTLKGNVKFMEPFICGTIYLPAGGASAPSVKKMSLSGNTDANRLFADIRRFIPLNYKKNFNAMTGIANNKNQNIIKDLYTSNTLKYKESHGYDIKEAINSLRVLFLLRHYIETGEFSFRVKDNPAYRDLEKYIDGIKSGLISKSGYLVIFDKVLSLAVKADSLAYRHGGLDAMEKKINDSVRELCRKKACFEKKA